MSAVEFRIVDGQFRGRQGQLRVAGQPLDVRTGLEKVRQIEVLDFTRDLRLETGCVKEGDGADAALAGQNRLPEPFDANAVGRHDSHSRYNNPVCAHY